MFGFGKREGMPAPVEQDPQLERTSVEALEVLQERLEQIAKEIPEAKDLSREEIGTIASYMVAQAERDGVPYTEESAGDIDASVATEAFAQRAGARFGQPEEAIEVSSGTVTTKWDKEHRETI